MVGDKRKNTGELDKLSIEEISSRLDVDPERGLSSEEAQKRLERYGRNTIEAEKKNPILKFLGYFWGPIPWMLEAACILSAIGARWEEFFVIFGMLLINGGVGWVHESRAEKAVEALKAQLSPRARVVRDGNMRATDAKEIVPGDVIVVRRGDLVPADAKLLASGLSLDESALTGESLPVEKNRGDPLYASTAVKRGQARAIVIATGISTHFGRTVELVARTAERSHFQKAVMRIGYFLMGGTAALVLGVLSVEITRGQSFTNVLLFALILVVAGIPVALPAVLSVTMAVGARRLAEQKAIVSHLAAMEELAGVRILFSDKTGTLTRNELALQEPVLIEGKDTKELVQMAALTADTSEERDPIDGALLSQVGPEALRAFHIEEFHPFDSTRKLAESHIKYDGGEFWVAKGAPQVVLELCHAEEALREKVSQKVDELGAAGFRALGVARRDQDRYLYLGLISLLDPPRADSKEVIESAKAHGIDVRMVTGDHAAIARQVAVQVGLGQNILPVGDWLESKDEEAAEKALSADGFAEVTPEDKFRLVERFQRKGFIVAMTGDGVNDAPALKKADVGIAVSGATDAARAASDLVLTEPGLGVIINAIEEARRIFERMLSYATFRIAETTRMLLFISVAIVVFRIHPVTAIMVALLAILNDIPIMTIATDNTETPGEPVRWNMRWVLADAAILGLTGVLASFGLLWFAWTYLDLALPALQTLLFLKLLVAGHMTIYVTRVRDWFWRRPWPSWKLLVALESTQVIGTLFAVYGILVTPIGWGLALLVWGFAIVEMSVLSAARVLAFKKLRPKLEARDKARVSHERSRAERRGGPGKEAYAR